MLTTTLECGWSCNLLVSCNSKALGARALPNSSVVVVVPNSSVREEQEGVRGRVMYPKRSQSVRFERTRAMPTKLAAWHLNHSATTAQLGRGFPGRSAEDPHGL